jgi:hypothetical protein
MATSDRTTPSVTTVTPQQALLIAQFQLYRGIVAKKHGIAVWLPVDPNALTGPEIEQWVSFLKDAAHLPPG